MTVVRPSPALRLEGRAFIFKRGLFSRSKEPMNENQPTLETERLILRPLHLSDAADVQRLSGDFEIADTTLNIPHPYPDGAAEVFIHEQPGKFARGESVAFAVTLKSTRELIGVTSIGVVARFRQGELGYWIGRPYWNHGFATEAARAVVEFVFHHWSLHKIKATYFARNPASGRVMAKIGLVQEGVLREHVLKWDRFEDIVICGLIKT
jgi:ribosomal-protein-alanine N-acetyltransferase